MYYELINNPDGDGLIVCSKCGCQPLTIEQFDRELNGFAYCDECWNFIHLKKWVCDTCNTGGILRSERTVYKEHCGESVRWYQ